MIFHRTAFELVESLWFTPLHQAAWQGVPLSVVEKLLELGAWRSMPTCDGRTAFDIAMERKHTWLLEALRPLPSPLDGECIAALDHHFAEFMMEKSPTLFENKVRLPPVAILHECPKHVFFRIPFGFVSMQLAGEQLEVCSGNRMTDFLSVSILCRNGDVRPGFLYKQIKNLCCEFRVWFVNKASERRIFL